VAIQNIAENKKRIEKISYRNKKKQETIMKSITDQIEKHLQSQREGIEETKNRINLCKKELEEALKSTGMNADDDIDSFRHFLQCYEQVQRSLVANTECVTTIGRTINEMSGWLELKCSTKIDLEAVLNSRGLVHLTDSVRDVGLSSPIHLCISTKEFEQYIEQELKQKINIHDVIQLKKVCEELSSKKIQKMNKKHEKATKTMVIHASRPLRAYLGALECGMREAGKVIAIKGPETI